MKKERKWGMKKRRKIGYEKRMNEVKEEKKGMRT